MSVPSETELVDFEAKAYDPLREPFVTTLDNAVRVFLDPYPDFNLFEIQGTRDRIGWALDFLAIPVHPGVDDAQLGFVHAGFDVAARFLMQKLAGAIIGAKPWALVCHSLGAAVGLRIATKLSLNGSPPLFVRAYAPPRVGGDKFVAAAAKIPNLLSYRNGDDPVPQVPFTLPDFPYQQVPLAHVGPAETPTNAFSFLPPEIFKRVGFHHIAAYQHAIHGDA